MARGTQLSVTMENKPGELAKLGAALARAKVNIEAISVLDSSDVGVIRLVTSSNTKARAALKKAGQVAQQARGSGRRGEEAGRRQGQHRVRLRERRRRGQAEHDRDRRLGHRPRGEGEALICSRPAEG
jgi:hypothetical protein